MWLLAGVQGGSGGARTLEGQGSGVEHQQERAD